MENQVEKLKEMVGKCRVGMLGLYRNDQCQFSPASHVDIDDQGNLWFFTSTKSTNKIAMKHNSSVHLSYLHEADSTFLSIEGIAHLNDNKAKMRELFNPFLKAWFPDGLHDSSISLLVVQPLEVDYWINNENKVLVHTKMLLSGNSKTQNKVTTEI